MSIKKYQVEEAMSTNKPRNAFLLLVLGILGSLLLTGPSAVKAGIFEASNEVTYKAVSYTHLDVYKRQPPTRNRRPIASAKTWC